jgi:hypothetical protein
MNVAEKITEGGSHDMATANDCLDARRRRCKIGTDDGPFNANASIGRLSGKSRIISRKNDQVSEISEELRALGVNDRGVFDKLGISIDSIASRRLARNLRAYAKQSPESAARTFVWKPDFQGSFLLFDFNNLEVQYAATEAWAAKNAPISLERYLSLTTTSRSSPRLQRHGQPQTLGGP